MKKTKLQQTARSGTDVCQQSRPYKTSLGNMRMRLSPVLLVGLACVELCLGKAIDEIIMDAADNSKMFDLMHMSPEGEVMVMVDLDIMMTVKEYMQYTAGHVVNSRHARKAVANTRNRWPDRNVYFEFNSDFWEDRTSIDAAMAEWQEHTCLRFTPAQSGTPDRIQFQKGDGCFSYLGKTGGTQPIGLARGCLQRGVVAHEIGHAIGWIHEQARPDRDQYIRVNFDRIPENWHPQFNRVSENRINYYNVPYDYRSIMHYSGNALATRSIETLDPTYQQIIGQRGRLSYKDIKLANLMYDCSGMNMEGGCQSDCSRYGDAYQDKNCQCMCPGKTDTLPVVLCEQGGTTVDPVTTTTRPGPTTTTSTTTTKPQPIECRDVRRDCARRARAGECRTNAGNMAMFCKQSCNFCDKDTVCMDYQDFCPTLSEAGFCSPSSSIHTTARRVCPKSCGLCVAADPCDTQRALGLAESSNGHPGNAYSHHLLAVISLLITAVVH